MILGPPGWQTNRSIEWRGMASAREKIGEGRGDMGFDEGRQGAGQNDTETFRIDVPAHDVQRVGPEMLAGSRDGRQTALTGPQDGRRRPIGEKRGGDHVGRGELVRPDRQGAEFHGDEQHGGSRRRSGETRRHGQPGDSCRAAEPEERDARDVLPEAEPVGAVRIEARGRNPGGRRGDDDVDIRSVEADPGQRRPGGLLEQVARALEIDFGPVRPAMRFEVPGKRPRRAAAEHARSLEDRLDLVEIRELLGQDRPGRCGHVPLVQNMGRNGGGEREHGGRREHLASSSGGTIGMRESEVWPSTSLYQNAPRQASPPRTIGTVGRRAGAILSPSRSFAKSFRHDAPPRARPGRFRRSSGRPFVLS